MLVDLPLGELVRFEQGKVRHIVVEKLPTRSQLPLL